MRAILALVQMIPDRLRKLLGMEHQEDSLPLYCFVGSGAMLRECRKLSQRKALDAAFCRKLNEVGQCNVLVYDVDSSFKYEDVLKYARKYKGKFQIGTYSRKSRVLLTSSEVIL